LLNQFATCRTTFISSSVYVPHPISHSIPPMIPHFYPTSHSLTLQYHHHPTHINLIQFLDFL
jgi:hypothetical protein